MKKLLLILILLLSACAAHADIRLPANLTAIEAEAFAGNTGLKGKLVIPDGVTTIGESAFRGCTGITQLVLPDSVTTIADYAFSGCVNLEVIIPGTGQDIADNAFDGCSNVVMIPTEPSPVSDFGYEIENGEVTILSYTGASANVVIPDTIEGYPVTKIGEVYVGEETKHLTIPSTVRTIGEDAFSGANLESVFIKQPSKLTHIGAGAFAYNPNLSYFNFPDSISYIGGWAFAFTDLSGELHYIGTVDEDPTSGITFYETPGMAAFVYERIDDTSVRLAHCLGELKNIIIPETVGGCTVTEIADDTFYNGGFESITLPETIVSIGDGAFGLCENLKSIALPDGLAHLGESAFSGSGIESVNIPKGITEIPEYCFYNTNLTELVIPDHITGIGQAAYAYSGLKSVVIPESVTSCGAYLFSHCTELSQVTLEAAVKELPAYMFDSCTSLASIDLPDSIETIGPGTFQNTVSLISVNIPANITEINQHAFMGSGIVNKAVERVVNEVIKDGMSEFEKALALHDWLICNARYDTDLCFYGAEGVLIYGRGVCQSYTNAYQLLLNAVDVKNLQVISETTMNHTWNLVSMDGEWYHVDCTWDDPTPDGLEYHQYFGLNDDLMSQTHRWDNAALLPVASGTRYQYGVDNMPHAPSLEPLPTPPPAPDYPESPVTDFEYTVSGGEVTITKYRGASANVVVPATIESCPVTKIGANSFIVCDTMETVTFPLTVKAIEQQAFYGCTNLKAVYGTANTLHYGSFAFSGCTSLSSVFISADTETLEYGCFKGTALPKTELCLPAGSMLNSPSTFGYGEDIYLYFFRTEGAEAAFVRASCGSEEQYAIDVPDNYRGLPVTAIASQAFYYNSSINALSLPSSIKRIDAYAFYECPNLVATIYTGGCEIAENAFGECPGITLVNEPHP